MVGVVGISPFGIYRPGQPRGVQGFDQCEGLYADAKLWLNRGWCDYFVPQLYWPLDAKQQPYAELLEWWNAQNTRGRMLVAGNYASRAAEKWGSAELVEQVSMTRAQGAAGNIFFSMKALMRADVGQALREGPYAERAQVPGRAGRRSFTFSRRIKKAGD